MRRSDEPLQTHELATNAPHGWDVAALGQGATDARVHVVLGLIALLLGALLAMARVRRIAA